MGQGAASKLAYCPSLAFYGLKLFSFTAFAKKTAPPGKSHVKGKQQA